MAHLKVLDLILARGVHTLTLDEKSVNLGTAVNSEKCQKKTINKMEYYIGWEKEIAEILFSKSFVIS